MNKKYLILVNAKLNPNKQEYSFFVNSFDQAVYDIQEIADLSNATVGETKKYIRLYKMSKGKHENEMVATQVKLSVKKSKEDSYYEIMKA